MSLEAWFSEAKHALAVAGPICSHANTLISTSRKQIEQAAVLWAQASFVTKSVRQQFEFLDRIHSSLRGLQKASVQDFDLTLEHFTSMDQRLETALRALDNTRLDGSFSKSRKTLRSFIFEDGIRQLRSSVASIKADVFNCDDELTRCINLFEKDIKSLSTRLDSVDNKLLMRDSLENAHESTDLIARDAREMATMLESLTRHYDLCLRGIELSNGEQTFEVRQELRELALVLERDSKEVEGVVAELYDRKNAIEESELSVAQFHSQLVETHQSITKGFDELSSFGKSKLKDYSKQLDDLSKSKSTYVQNMTSLLQENEALVKYYEMFMKSYHAMILEILRRKKSEELMTAVVKDMTVQLSQMHTAEVDARQKFIKERGDFLPSDLWEGLTDLPQEPHIVMEHSIFPELSETTIARAIKEF